MMRKPQIFRVIQPLAIYYPWAIPTVISLGILSSLSQGLGISLFIPFLQSLDQSSSNVLESASFIEPLNQLLEQIPLEQRIFVIPLCIFGCILLKNLLLFVTSMLSVWLYNQLGHYLVSKIFNQLLSVNYSFLDRNRSGTLLNTLSTQTWEVCDAIDNFIWLVVSLCTVTVLAPILILISWQLTLLVIVSVFITSTIIQRLSRPTRRFGYQSVQANELLAHRIMEGFQAMRVIRAFGQEAYEQKRFERASKALKAVNMKLFTISSAIAPTSEVLSTALSLCILIVSLVQGWASLPVLLTFILVLHTVQAEVKELEQLRNRLMASIAAVDDVLSLLNLPEQDYIRSGNIPFKELKKAITFKAVSFGYEHSEKNILHDVSLRIPKNKTVAIVGPSGAGKSTLISLLCRFYDPAEGEIYVDDDPLPTLDLVSWRSKIGIVSQDVHVFSTTIRENIAYGKLDATKDEVIRAAKYAYAHEYIHTLPEGYDTEVGDRGVRLSGGQRQRLALARAIVRDPEILILDEATNALDSIAEFAIQEALETLRQNRTIIVIAHRLSTIKQADHIIVLDQGRVLEQGSFDQLLRSNGLFTKLYKLQSHTVEAEV
jgi:ATP-binding cassette, subfamily B, bacterial MsbA